ncbi:DUF1254 domain-containing protein [Bacillus shivajii]|uniref:DUF1254 domain-containing protein n=1 Tax=Bacillus shivajii TaxID=1983719 RepID=UPI001CF93AB3|nr:DUF1254 domain-containing protein [Bacillus shivajii]UCZ54976.1 DUF1254 domain-containing protein [Bacillus shivajii]
MYYGPYRFQNPYYVAPMPDYRNQLLYQNYQQGGGNLNPYYSSQIPNTQGVVPLSNHRKQPINIEDASIRENSPLSSYRENYAYSLGIQAYIYGYPLVTTERTRQLSSLVQESFGPAFTVSNEFIYYDELLTPDYKDVVSPNVDTLYFVGWLDLTRNPVVLNVPDTNDRYYVIQLLDAWTNTFSNIGRRTTGTDAGKFAIVGPDWKGILPVDVKEVKSPTSTVWIIGRILVKGEDDLENAQAIQKQFTMTTLDGKKAPSVIKPANTLLLENKVEDLSALDFFKTMTDLMILNPTINNEALEKQFEHIGIDLTYGFDANKLDPESIAGLNRAAKDAFQIIANSEEELNARIVNGWLVVDGLGTYGDEFLQRAYIAFSGLGANVNEEASAPRAFTDDQGNQLNGKNKYILHFNEDQLPPVEAFWSVTMYGSDFYLVPNEINRYAIGDHTQGLEYNDDGSLDIYIQKDRPINNESNWLPAPEGDFNLLLRLYQPEAKILTGSYEIPGVKRVR